mmetsp:Transcript_15418/g.60260  ORF Transcript_15418/g.60260 Transcript_15418/m.60260 type:complete len:185 (+) Transcript_15418:778-1332(+)
MSANENLSPAVLRKVLAEVAELAEHPMEDVTVEANEANLSEVHAVITGPSGTPYEGGKFKVVLRLGHDFPQAPPKGYFLTKIFHPNVSANGDICVNTLKKDWKEELGIKHVLLTVKCLLIVPNPESALNEEAGRMLLEAYEEYAKRAQLFTSIYAASATPEKAAAVAPAKKQVQKKRKKNLKRL